MRNKTAMDAAGPLQNIQRDIVLREKIAA